MGEHKYVIGVDLGGTKVAVALADKTYKILHQVELPSELYTGRGIPKTIEAIDRVVAESRISWSQIANIAIGVPGIREEKTGIYLKDMVKKAVEDRFKKPVVVDNDAHVAGLGELKYGAGRGAKNLVYLTIGTGIGGAIIINEKIYRGQDGLAGEVGHMSVNVNGPKCACGNRGCLHLYASGTALTYKASKVLAQGKIKSLIQELSGGLEENITGEIIAEAASEGDLLAVKLLEDIAKYLGIAIVTLVNILNPELIILGGGVAQAGELLFKPVREMVKERILADKIKIVPSELGVQAGVKGAVALAIEHLRG